MSALGSTPPTHDDSAGVNLEWFRPDPRPKLYRTYFIGMLMLLSGMGCCAAGFFGLRVGSGFSEGAYTALMIIGVLTVASAMVLFVRRALWVLGDETCLVLRVDGVRFERAGAATHVPWDVIESVRADGEALCIDTDDPRLGQMRVRVRFTDIDAAELATKIEATRRRALMGLLG